MRGIRLEDRRLEYRIDLEPPLARDPGALVRVIVPVPGLRLSAGRNRHKVAG